MIKILKSLMMIGVVAALAIGVTGAFFSDTETSTGNVFTAGELDLEIDSTCHYNGMVCECVAGSTCTWQAENPNDPDSYVETKDAKIDGPCSCTWAAKDLAGERFFDYKDIKPGDWGENTLSFHVIDNDAWGRVKITAIENRENGCNDPERELPDPTCVGRWCGELAQNMYSFVWVDNGVDPTDENDPTRGDNIYQEGEEIVIGNDASGSGEDCADGTIPVAGPNGLTYCQMLPDVAAAYACNVTGGGQGDLPDGNEIVIIPITEGIFLEGCVTNYLGVAWYIPKTVNNIIQGDSIKADISFEIIQARHNDSTDPFAPIQP